MSSQAHEGQVVAFVGKSKAEYEGEPGDETLVTPATLEKALDDAARQAVEAGYKDVTLRVGYIDFVATNPHIKEVSVIATPGE